MDEFWKSYFDTMEKVAAKPFSLFGLKPTGKPLSGGLGSRLFNLLFRGRIGSAFPELWNTKLGRILRTPIFSGKKKMEAMKAMEGRHWRYPKEGTVEVPHWALGTDPWLQRDVSKGKNLLQLLLGSKKG